MPDPLVLADPAGFAPAADERADLGVLYVHGIGEQAQGETLAAWAEPVIDWLRSWLGRDAPRDAIVAATPLAAALKPPLVQPGVPAHSAVIVGRRHGGQEQAQRWLFAEAWWGQQVLAPGIADFTVWLLTRGPWVLLWHLDVWLLAGRGAWQQVLRAVPVALAWMLGSLAMNALLLAAALLALLPLGALRRIVLAVLRALAGIIGDAYVLIRHPLQRTAFEQATLEALAWLRPRCRRIAVVAHSQGAAVAHGALQRPDAPLVEMLVTVGSGIAKLQALRWFERQTPSDRVAALLAPPFVLAAALVWLRARQNGLDDWISSWIGPGFLALLGLAFLLVAWVMARHSAARLRENSEGLCLDGAPAGFEWCDIAATHDPVSLGTLGRYFDPARIGRLTERPLSVLRSWFADHTSYWQARASFIPELVRCLARCAEADFVEMDAAGERLQRSGQRRDFDLRMLRWTRRLDWASWLLAVVVGWRRLVADVLALREALRGTDGGPSPLRVVDTTLAEIEGALRWLVELVTGAPAAAWTRPAIDGGFAALLLAIALLLWQRLAFVLWEVWSDNNVDAALRRPPDAAAPLPLRERVLARGSEAFIDAGMTFVLVLPFAVAVVWALGPADWFTEARAYALLGQTVTLLLLAMAVFGWVSDLAQTLDDARRTAATAWQQGAGRRLPPRLLGVLMALARRRGPSS